MDQSYTPRCAIGPNSSFTVTAVIDPFFDFISNITLDSNSQPKFHPSFTTELLFALQFVMNKTFIMKISKRWGELDSKTNEWNGMIGHILNEEADLAISPMTILHARQQAVDFNIVTTSDKLSAFYLSPRFKPNSFGLLKPLDAFAWLAILLTYGAVAALIGFYAGLQLYDSKRAKRGTKNENNSKFTMADSYLWACAMMCSKGLGDVPPAHAIRIVVLKGSLLGLILNSFYGANLTSFLTVSVEPFGNLGQILRTKYEFAFSGYFPIQQAVKGSSLATIRQAYSRPSQESHNRLDEAKPSILKGSYVFIDGGWRSYKTLGNDFSEKERCRIGHFVIPQVRLNFATAVRKSSGARRCIDYHIIQFKQYGLNDLWEKRHIPMMPTTSCDLLESTVSVELESIHFGLYLISAGSALSFGVLLVEKIFEKMNTNRAIFW